MSSVQRITSSAMQVQNRQLDFLTVKQACPKGLYLIPAADDPARWEAVLFVRKGVYAPAILRFHIAFPIDYPDRPPGITFSTDIFHPLITPLTTYTYSTQDSGADTVSASDQERLPPGGFSLRHAFPQWPGWHHASHHAQASIETTTTAGEVRPVNDFDSSSRPLQDVSDGSDRFRAPHILEVLFYLRSAFTSEAILDSIPLGAAANSGAWHAWQSFRARTARSTTPSTSDTLDDRSSLKQQPGGAKRPGEWNWEGVWEDRVSRGVKGSLAEHAVFASPASGEQMINFQKIDPQIQDTFKIHA